MLPREGFEAEEQEEEEMTTEEAAEESRANRAYLAANARKPVVEPEARPVVTTIQTEEVPTGSHQADLKAMGIDEYFSVVHEAAKQSPVPEARQVATKTPVAESMPEPKANEETEGGLPVEEPVSTPPPVVAATKERPAEVPVREGDRPALAAELATIINTA